jgi:hypothetical protein
MGVDFIMSGLLLLWWGFLSSAIRHIHLRHLSCGTRNAKSTMPRVSWTDCPGSVAESGVSASRTSAFRTISHSFKLNAAAATIYPGDPLGGQCRLRPPDCPACGRLDREGRPGGGVGQGRVGEKRGRQPAGGIGAARGGAVAVGWKHVPPRCGRGRGNRLLDLPRWNRLGSEPVSRGDDLVAATTRGPDGPSW